MAKKVSQGKGKGKSNGILLGYAEAAKSVKFDVDEDRYGTVEDG